VNVLNKLTTSRNNRQKPLTVADPKIRKGKRG